MDHLHKTSESSDAAVAQLAAAMSQDMQSPDYKGLNYLQRLLAEARGFRYLDRKDTRRLPMFDENQIDKRYKGLINKKSSESGLEKRALGPIAALPWIMGPLMAYWGYQGAKDALKAGKATLDDLGEGHLGDAAGDAGWALFNAATTAPMVGMPLRALGKGLKAAAVGSKAGQAVMTGRAAALHGLSDESKAVLEAMAKDPGALKWAAGRGKDLGKMDWAQKLLNSGVGRSREAAAAAWKYGDKLDSSLALRSVDFFNRPGMMVPYISAQMGVPLLLGEPGYEKRERERAESKQNKRRELADRMGIPYFEEG